MLQEFDRAMDRIRDEMAKAKSTNVQALGEIMTALLQARPEIAGAILADGKTLGGCWAAMEAYAKKHKTGNSYAMGPDTAQAVICEYYGFSMEKPALLGLYAGSTPAATAGTSSGAGATATEGKAQTPAPVADTPEAPDPFDLDALLASAESGLSPSDPEDSPGETRAQGLPEGAGREMGVL